MIVCILEIVHLYSLKENPREIDALSIQVHVLTNLAYFEFMQLKVLKKDCKDPVESQVLQPNYSSHLQRPP